MTPQIRISNPQGIEPEPDHKPDAEPKPLTEFDMLALIEFIRNLGFEEVMRRLTGQPPPDAESGDEQDFPTPGETR